MDDLPNLSMEVLRVSSHKVVDTLAHSQSTTNMSKSISGASLSSSQATQRTKCGSEFSSAGGSARFANLSSSSQAADALGSSNCSAADSSAPRVVASRPAAAPGGGKTVVGGVAPTMEGMLRRRARFSGWKAEAVYFELRSTVLLSFATSGSSFNSSSSFSSSGGGGGGGRHRMGGTGGGGGHHSSGLATLAAKIMHTQTKRAGAWSWSLDLAGAERVRELPALTKKEMFAFAVEFPASSKKKTFIGAAGSADARERWMVAIDRARQSVRPQDFEPLSVIGEGHFGKVLLVRWKNTPRAPSPAPSAAPVPTPAHTASSTRHRRSPSSFSSSLTTRTPRLAEEEADEAAEERQDSSSSSSAADAAAPAAAAPAAAAPAAATTTGGEEGIGASAAAAAAADAHGYRFLAVKEVALHKGSSLPGVLNERQILGVLKEHPFVVTLRCAWRKGNFLYYGLDFLPGADLFELFRRNAVKMDLQAARVYGGQVALALEHLHSHGICYRDLKPENILVDAKGHLCLADMGLSKILGTGAGSLRTSTVCGTRAYLAPEMILHKPYGLSVDFWQFGCFVFELYAGHSPFWKPRSGPPGRAHDQTVALILAGEIRYPRSIDPVAKSFVRELLHPAVDSRLGCGAASTPSPVFGTPADSSAPADVAVMDASALQPIPRRENVAAGTTGWQSVKQHGFFGDMDWEALLRGEISAPIRPGDLGRGMVGNFSKEYTRQRAGWGGDQQELRDVAEKDVLFKRELMGFDFVRE